MLGHQRSELSAKYVEPKAKVFTVMTMTLSLLLFPDDSSYIFFNTFLKEVQVVRGDSVYTVKYAQ